MSNWKIVVPEATTNMVLNPSAEISGSNYNYESGTTGGQLAGYGKFGLHVYQITTTAANEGIELTLSALANATHYVTVYVRGNILDADSWDWSLDDSNWTVPTKLFDVDDVWRVYGASFSAAQSNGSTKLSIHQNGAGTFTFYLDGIQVEENTTWTTYCDGDQSGCSWNGAEHASTSTRSAMSRAGGRVKDLEDDYDLLMGGMDGFGMPPIEHDHDPFAMLAGGNVEAVKEHASSIVLYGTFNENSREDLHTKRQALVDELAPDKYPPGEFGPQPVLLRYYGAAIIKEIGLVYEDGFRGNINVQQSLYVEDIALKFTAPDPYWYELGGTAVELDSADTITERHCAGRLRSTGQWDDLGLTSNPTAGIDKILTICVASDSSVYFGGLFEDWNGNAGDDTIIRFDPSDESWNTLVGANDINYVTAETVYDIVEGSDGTIYLCGLFEAVNGDGTADHIVAYNPSSNTWSSLGDPDATNITEMRDMAFDSAGNLYVVGDFSAVAGVANTANIAMWDGSSWNAVGGGITIAAGYPFAIAIDSQDNIIIGGSCTHATLEDYIFRYDGSSWDDLDSGTQYGNIDTLTFSADDILYLGGTFTNQGGDADCDYICTWNGRQFAPLGDLVTGVDDLAIAPDGRIFIAGTGVGTGDVASWNGSAWEIWDTTSAAGAIAVGPSDPVVNTNYDIWVGTSASASREIAGSTTVTNGGTSSQRPVFKVSRSGGTSATFYSIRNEGTGKALMFNYGLLDGETLTIDCRPMLRSITSDYRGKQPSAILANSDFGSFTLLSGDNQITCFVDTAGSPTITAWCEFRAAYKGAD